MRTIATHEKVISASIDKLFTLDSKGLWSECFKMHFSVAVY